WKEVVREGLERLRAAGLFDEYSQDNEEVEYLKAVAAEALGRIGDTATPAVPALLAALQDPGRGSFGVRVARPPFWASRLVAVAFGQGIRVHVFLRRENMDTPPCPEGDESEGVLRLRVVMPRWAGTSGSTC